MDDEARLILRSPRRLGTTYFAAAAPYDGWVKIGRTNGGDTSALRLGALQVGNPRRLTIRATLPVDVEWHLHRYYAPFRGVGEWFALPIDLIRDAAHVRSEPDPLAALLERWPHGAIRRVAGGMRVRSPDGLARLFASDSHFRRPRQRPRLPEPQPRAGAAHEQAGPQQEAT